jgi:hypothetical protein
MSEKCRMNRNSVLAIVPAITPSIAIEPGFDYTYSCTAIRCPGPRSSRAEAVKTWAGSSDLTATMPRRGGLKDGEEIVLG